MEEPPDKGKFSSRDLSNIHLASSQLVGEVLVVKDGHRALALLENPDNLLVDPPARQVATAL